MNAIVVSLGTARREQVLDDVRQLLADGAEVSLVVTKREAWDVPDGVGVTAIGDVEARHPVLSLERLLVLRLPRLVYQLGARTLSLAARLPGPTRRAVRRAQAGWKRRWIVVRDATGRFHKERWGTWYANVRPFVLWRMARRHVVGPLRVSAGVQLIVVGDALSVPTGWHLARRFPMAGVGFSLAEAVTDRDRQAAGDTSSAARR